MINKTFKLELGITPIILTPSISVKNAEKESGQYGAEVYGRVQAQGC
jgi:hypothetical protein